MTQKFPLPMRTGITRESHECPCMGTVSFRPATSRVHKAFNICTQQLSAMPYKTV